jgi:pimeloyl-ACP methyl ester carboxylesterase
MERALQKEGFATLNLAYPSRKYPLEVLVENVHAAIHPFALQTDALHFVTHSMGGLLAQFYLAKDRSGYIASSCSAHRMAAARSRIF